MGTTAIATAKEVFDLLHDDLLAIEQEFGRDAVSSVAAITEITGYLRESGGKRLRPSLLLLACHSLGYSGAPMHRLGAVVEMIHTATLVHDDIIDGAELRRGRPSPNTTWGNSRCVLAGDWLYMQAFRIALAEQNFRILELLIGLTQVMVEGELLQTEKLGRAVTAAEYNELIYRKTACLFEVSMRLGAVLAGAGPEVEQCLATYGHSLGLAFQIVDDVLDLTADEQVLGKPVASDLREGKATLAVVHALEHASPAEQEAILQVLADGAFTTVRYEDVLATLARHGSIAFAMQVARDHAETARRSLDLLPESEYKRALLWVPDFVVNRDK
ncbi:polyprenyl synthetase family protein [Acidipila sp. EB88]|uniref:polyprenyl synthetase family protein n=1 Tax=Acidipila sp. EB88 TaxID=2305226 RepID=UPI000F5D782C|nr:polyprenyl synthetase family protein [Acidipila sp. EB88]RRA49899.1 polyprenyl synthetase family protein [Acidipila sp. EB88]